MEIWEPLVIIFIWECLRFTFVKLREYGEIQERDSQLEECNRCGVRTPDIAYHMKHCSNRFRHSTYYRPEDD